MDFWNTTIHPAGLATMTLFHGLDDPGIDAIGKVQAFYFERYIASWRLISNDLVLFSIHLPPFSLSSPSCSIFLLHIPFCRESQATTTWVRPSRNPIQWVSKPSWLSPSWIPSPGETKQIQNGARGMSVTLSTNFAGHDPQVTQVDLKIAFKYRTS